MAYIINEDGTITRVCGYIKNIWVDYNEVDWYGNFGMVIHLRFDINGLMGKTGQAVVYYYYANGKPIKDTNGLYRTVDGDVAHQVSFTPFYEKCTFYDLSFFMPYREMHLYNSTLCYFSISLWFENKEITRSNRFYFTFTQR